MADMGALMDLARQYRLAVIEDAAQSIGSTLLDRQAGAWGDAAGFSLHPLKNLNAASDAGFLSTRHAEVAERIRRLIETYPFPHGRITVSVGVAETATGGVTVSPKAIAAKTHLVALRRFNSLGA